MIGFPFGGFCLQSGFQAWMTNGEIPLLEMQENRNRYRTWLRCTKSPRTYSKATGQCADSDCGKKGPNMSLMPNVTVIVARKECLRQKLSKSFSLSPPSENADACTQCPQRLVESVERPLDYDW